MFLFRAYQILHEKSSDAEYTSSLWPTTALKCDEYDQECDEYIPNYNDLGRESGDHVSHPSGLGLDGDYLGGEVVDHYGGGNYGIVGSGVGLEIGHSSVGLCSPSIFSELPLRSSTITLTRNFRPMLPTARTATNTGKALSEKKRFVRPYTDPTPLKHQPVVLRLPQFSQQLKPFLLGLITDENERHFWDVQFREEVVSFLE